MDENNQPNNQVNGNTQPVEPSQTPVEQPTQPTQPQVEQPVQPVQPQVQQPIQQPVQNPQVNQAAFTQPTAPNFNAAQQQPKKKGKGGLIAVIIILLALLIAVVGGIAFFFGVYQSPEQVYKRIVESTIDTYSNELDKLGYDTVKSTIKLSADVDLKGVDSSITELINNIDVSLNTQVDMKNQKVLANIETDYNKKDLLNAQVYSSAKDEKTYVYLKDFFDKYIEVDMDSNAYDSIKEVFESERKITDKKDTIKKALNVVKKEITNSIKKEYCSSEKAKVNINGKDVNTTKNTIKMNEKQFTSEVNTIIKNLKESKEFLACFEDSDKVKEALENIISELDDTSTDESATIEINVYMTGLIKQQMVKFEAKVEETEQKVAFEVTKIEENNYKIIASQDGKEVMNGTIAVEKKNENEGTAKISVNINELGKVELKVKYAVKLNEKIDEINPSNSVKLDAITQEDQKKILISLQNSELYKLITKFGGSTSELPNIGGDPIDNNNTEPDIDNPDTNVIDGNIVDSNTVINNNTTNTPATLQQNQILTYDDKTKVTFGIPTGYTVNHISDSYASMKNDNVSIIISSTLGTETGYYNELTKQKENYSNGKKDSTYVKFKNANLTQKESITIGANTFSTATLSYDGVSTSSGATTSYKTSYIWLPVSEKYVLDIKISDYKNQLTNADLQQILNAVTFENVK